MDDGGASTGLPSPAPGWGHAPHASVASGRTTALPPPPTDGSPDGSAAAERAGRRTRRLERWSAIFVLVAVPLLLGGALTYVSASPEGTHMAVRVLESPTGAGGVLLDAPRSSGGSSSGGATVVRNQPWETHDLDPETLRAGDMADVQVRSDCLCDPFIDEGSPLGQVVALALIGLGIVSAALAFVTRRLPSPSHVAGPSVPTGGAVPPAPAPTDLPAARQ